MVEADRICKKCGNPAQDVSGVCAMEDFSPMWAHANKRIRKKCKEPEVE